MHRIALVFTLTLLLVGRAWSLAAPTNVSATSIVLGASSLSWDYDVNPTQWLIYVNGNLSVSPTRAQVSLLGSRFVFTLVNVASPSILNMRAVQGSTTSGFSNSVTVTGSLAANYVVQQGSDAVLPLYTTVPAGLLPAVAPYVAQYAPGYEFGACTTCTAGARFMAFVRPNASYITALTCATTMTTGVQGINLCFLTPAARTRTTIFNPSASGKVLRYLEWYSATPPAFDASSLPELTPGASVVIEDCLPYLNLFSPGGVPAVLPSVLHVTDTKWQSLSYP